jgi:hypothetical protein
VIGVGPGTVLAVWTSASWTSNFIRAGYALRGKPSLANHVAIVTHRDKFGRWIAVQGQPGGVSLVDVTPWLKDKRTRANTAQPRPGGQAVMDAFLASCAKSIGIRYDWAGIAEDGVADLQIHDLSHYVNTMWEDQLKHGRLPGEVVCSSLAAALYSLSGWAHPDFGDERRCQPGDWWGWNDQELWKQA